MKRLDILLALLIVSLGGCVAGPYVPGGEGGYGYDGGDGFGRRDHDRGGEGHHGGRGGEGHEGRGEGRGDFQGGGGRDGSNH